MLKKIITGLLVLLSVLADTSILPFLPTPVGGYILPVTLVITVALALVLGRTRGMLLGFIGGVLLDVSVGYPVGLVMILYTITGYLSALLAHMLRGNLLSTVVPPAVAFFLYEGVMYAYHVMATSTLDAAPIGAMLLRVFIGLVIVQPLYFLFKQMLKPKLSRYGNR